MTGKLGTGTNQNQRRYILVVSGQVGNKNVEETFEVTAEEYEHYGIGNTFILDAVLENEGGEENDWIY